MGTTTRTETLSQDGYLRLCAKRAQLSGDETLAQAFQGLRQMNKAIRAVKRATLAASVADRVRALRAR